MSDERLANGMYAVDLSAVLEMTYQLVAQYGSTSVDKCPMAPYGHRRPRCVRMASGTVRTGIIFHAWSAMVEKPGQSHRVNGAVAGNGWCRETILTFKLPMKTPCEEVSHNR